MLKVNGVRVIILKVIALHDRFVFCIIRLLNKTNEYGSYAKFIWNFQVK